MLCKALHKPPWTDPSVDTITTPLIITPLRSISPIKRSIRLSGSD
jgi:hypothetical protein